MTEKHKPQLNIRQLKFIDGLMSGKTQKQAYMDAGYAVDKGNSSEVAACQLLRNVKVQEEIAGRINDIKNKNKIRLGRISEVALEKLLNMLQSDEEIADSRVKADLIKFALESIGLKAAEQHDINLKGEIKTSLPEEKKIELIRLAYESVGRDMPGEGKKTNRE